MIRNLIAFPLLALIVILQSAVVSQITLLAGYADLMLIVLSAWALRSEPLTAWLWSILGAVMVSFVSAMPWPIVLVRYLFVVFLAQFLRRRVWQVPILAMFGVVFVGTIAMELLAFLVLNLLGTPLSLGDSFGLVVLPSVLLNLLLAVPVYVIVRDLTQWLVPEQEVE